MVKIISGDLVIYVEGTYEQVCKKIFRAFNSTTRINTIEITGYLNYTKQNKATAYFQRADSLLIIDLN